MKFPLQMGVIKDPLAASPYLWGAQLPPIPSAPEQFGGPINAEGMRFTGQWPKKSTDHEAKARGWVSWIFFEFLSCFWLFRFFFLLFFVEVIEVWLEGNTLRFIEIQLNIYKETPERPSGAHGEIIPRLLWVAHHVAQWSTRFQVSTQ